MARLAAEAAVSARNNRLRLLEEAQALQVEEDVARRCPQASAAAGDSISGAGIATSSEEEVCKIAAARLAVTSRLAK